MRTLMLLDIDCFFASVEMARHPELRGRPLCVGGRRGERGIVVCPNYEARAYGVQAAMPLRTAERMLPPGALFLPGNRTLYSEYSERVMETVESFTPDVEQVSVDEAYLDVSGCLHLWRDVEEMALALKERVAAVCGLTVSIGVASSRICAKIAAGLGKPNGLVVVPAGGEKEFLVPLPVDVVPGIGPKTRQELNARGIRTVGDLLAPAWGRETPVGRHLAAAIEGRQDPHVSSDRIEHSLSRETTFGKDTSDRDLLTSTLYYLLERCCKTLRKRQQQALTVAVKVRSADFTTLQKQTTLRLPTAQEEDLFGCVRTLLPALLPPQQLVRLVGVRVSHLVPTEGTQMALGMDTSERREALHQRLDALQEKHGYRSIHWGITHALKERNRGETRDG
jgi:DNA polymerase-4